MEHCLLKTTNGVLGIIKKLVCIHRTILRVQIITGKPVKSGCLSNVACTTTYVLKFNFDAMPISMKINGFLVKLFVCLCPVGVLKY